MRRTYWDDRWANIKFSPEECLRRQNPRRSEVLQRECERHFGVQPFRMVEIGSGLGITSLLLSLNFPAASSTLVDLSPPALRGAMEIHASFGRVPKTELVSLFDYEPDVEYDLVMSFGVIEHFVGEMRQRALERHFKLAREGGLVFVSVPNRHCPLYRFDMFLIRLLRKKRTIYSKFSRSRSVLSDVEHAFSKAELRALVQNLPAAKLDIRGISFSQAIEDFLRFGRFPLERVGLRLLSRALHWPRIRLPFLDNSMGQMLLLKAEKASS